VALYLDIKINWKTIYTIRAVRVHGTKHELCRYKVSVISNPEIPSWKWLGEIDHHYEESALALSQKILNLMQEFVKKTQNNELKLAKELFRDELS